MLDTLAAVGPERVLLTAGQPAIMRELEAAVPGVPLGLSSVQCAAVLKGSFWGGVPAGNVVGRAVFIIYPFTPRWGPAE